MIFSLGMTMAGVLTFAVGQHTVVEPIAFLMMGVGFVHHIATEWFPYTGGAEE